MTGPTARLDPLDPCCAPETSPSGVVLRRLAIVASGSLAAVAALLAAAGSGPWAHALFALAALTGAATFLRAAWRAARAVRPDMNLLMTIAVVAALAIGAWFEAAVVAFLFALAEEIERASLERAHRSVEALLEAEPRTALRRRDGVEEEVPVEEISAGEVLVVRPGERVPLDGVVLEGRSAVDESPLTGEPVPSDKEEGAEVFAGTVNGPGLLVVRAVREAGANVLDRVFHLIQEARSADAPVVRTVDGFARAYTPSVLALALAAALLPPLLAGASWGDWFYRGLVLLVVACPCALVLSTPVAIVSGLAAAARSGVLVKGGAVLEEAGRLRGIAFDKTGTLTTGRIAVAEAVPLGGSSREGLLSLAAALERHSEHPIGRAVADWCAASGVSLPEVGEFQVVPGGGVQGRVEGRAAAAGSPRFLEESGVDLTEARPHLARLAASGMTAALVAREGGLAGLFALSDRPRPEARAAVGALRAAGIGSLSMLTGDDPRSAQAVAREVGIGEVEAGLLPGEKMEAVHRLRRRLGHLAMVGDGINDAPALAAASLGVALAAAGSDAALETADAALMADDLGKVVYLVRLGRRTLATIRFNIAFALLLKGLFVVLALAGLATLWMAVGADMGASLLVIANSLRLLRPAD